MLTWESPKEMIFEMPVRTSAARATPRSFSSSTRPPSIDRPSRLAFSPDAVVARRHASTSSVVRDDRGVSAVARERLDRSETRGASLPRLSRVQIFSSPRTANDG